MEWYLVLGLLLGILFLLLLTGLPVAMALFATTLIGAYIFMGGPLGLRALSLSIFNSLTKFSLTPVPLFVFMGQMLFYSGIAVKTLDVVDMWLGRIPGRLAILATGGGTLFAVMSGSTMANTATLGTLLLPQMMERKYDRILAMGSILGSSGLAMIIPPSSLAIIYGSIAQISIGKVLIAGIIPGLLMAALYATNIVLRCKFHPDLAPSYEPESVSIGEKLWLSVKHLLPVALIVFLVLGLMFFGVTTPTEAAALGATGSLLLTFFYRRLTWEVFKTCTWGTVRVTVMVLFIIAASQGYSQVMSFSGATRGVVETLTQLPYHPMIILFLMQLVVLLLGAFVDQVSIMLITVPLFMPVVTAYGWDPVWFAILMLINLEIAGTTPPFGLNLFVMQGVAPAGTKMVDIYRAAWPFIVCDIVALVLVAIFPILATWLPGAMM